MANLAIRGTFYRLEQLPGVAPTFALSSAPTMTLLAADIRRIDPVNVLGGADLGGFGYLYSKVTLKQAGLEQEFYALQTVLQLQAQINS